MASLNTVLCLMGPTASGKTRLAIELTQKFPYEIISVDSAMVYRDMNIGTAKPTAVEQAIAPHHLIDLCDPAEAYSAGRFCHDAQREIKHIQARGKVPLLVGGTMLYFHALQQGMAELPTANPEIRAEIDEEAKKVGWPAMHERLQKIDPEIAKRLKPNDAQRIQRALEIYYTTNETLSSLQKHIQKPNYQFTNIIIAPNDRSLLHRRIAQRFENMLQQGFIEEVEKLKKRGDLHENLPSIRTVGYRQIWKYLNGENDAATMKEKAIAATRQLAKRQFTWLRRWQDVQWFDAEKHGLVEEIKDYFS